jgi:uncharacterized protein (TIRG00374 family)
LLPTVNKTAITLLKIAVPVALLVWLIFQAHKSDPNTLQRFIEQPKNWPLLTAALLACFMGVIFSFVRWHMLVNCLGIPFRLPDAFRLGFIGYLLTFVSFGSVGGDLFKAFFIAKEQPERRTEAIASIFVDRVVGLYTLLLFTSVSVALIIRNRQNDELQVLATACWGLASVATIGVAVIMSKKFSLRWLAFYLRRYHWVYAVILRLDFALGMYRSCWKTVVAAIGISVVSHMLFATTIFLAARSVLSAECPSWAQHLVMWPVAGAASALPIAPGGLGTFEAILSYLYKTTAIPTVQLGDGLIIALLFRAMSFSVASMGVVMYWTRRRQIQTAIHEADSFGRT